MFEYCFKEHIKHLKYSCDSYIKLFLTVVVSRAKPTIIEFLLIGVDILYIVIFI